MWIGRLFAGKVAAEAEGRWGRRPKCYVVEGYVFIWSRLVQQRNGLFWNDFVLHILQYFRSHHLPLSPPRGLPGLLNLPPASWLPGMQKKESTARTHQNAKKREPRHGWGCETQSNCINITRRLPLGGNAICRIENLHSGSLCLSGPVPLTV